MAAAASGAEYLRMKASKYRKIHNSRELEYSLLATLLLIQQATNKADRQAVNRVLDPTGGPAMQ